MSSQTLEMSPRPCTRCATPVGRGRFCTTCGTAAPAPAQDGPTVPAQPAPLHLTQQADVPPWLAAEPPAPVRRRPKGLALVVVGALVVSAWAIAKGVEQHTVSGTVLVLDAAASYDLEPGDECYGEDGYDDVNDGAQVVIADEDGTTLSTGRLSPGEFDGLGCVFSFTLEDVSRADFYALNVAGENRGELQYSYDELAKDDWSVELTLGDD